MENTPTVAIVVDERRQEREQIFRNGSNFGEHQAQLVIIRSFLENLENEEDITKVKFALGILKRIVGDLID